MKNNPTVFGGVSRVGWYDFFSSFYDRSLEPLYREQRRAAAAALQLNGDERVLDLPCGTGQSFNTLASKCRVLVGADFSSGMLKQARHRAERQQWRHIELQQSDVHALTTDVPFDRLHIFLGLTAFPRWEEAFEHLWSLLKPGGRCVVVDVYAERPGLQGRMVNLVARADIRRRTWEPLEKLSTGFQRVDLPSTKQHGGQLFLASGDKPA